MLEKLTENTENRIIHARVTVRIIMLASLTLGIIKVFSRSRAQSANATKRSGVQFFPFTSAFNCATTAKTKGEKTGEFLLSRFLKKVHLIYGYSYKHFLSIEKAERLFARHSFWYS